MIQHLPPPPYRRKKPLPEIPQQEMPSYPVATSPPPPPMLPPDPYYCNGSMQSTLGLPSGMLVTYEYCFDRLIIRLHE